jgi:hypothetical protein
MGIRVRLAGLKLAGIAALAAPALLLLGSSEASSSSSDAKGLADDIFLTVHGPNDGEPLNNSVEVEAQSNVSESGYVLVYQGNKLIYMVPMAPPSVGVVVSSVRISIDTTRFHNGPVTLSFLLFNEPLDHVLARADWSGTVENPTVEPGEHRTEERVPVTLQGLTGDFGYMLLGCADGIALLQPPMEQPVSEKVQFLATGLFPNETWKGVPSTNLVLNLDDLVSLHTTKGSIILWTLNIDGKWYRSKIVPIRYLLSVPTSPYGDRVEATSRSAYRP